MTLLIPIFRNQDPQLSREYSSFAETAIADTWNVREPSRKFHEHDGGFCLCQTRNERFAKLGDTEELLHFEDEVIGKLCFAALLVMPKSRLLLAI